QDSATNGKFYGKMFEFIIARILINIVAKRHLLFLAPFDHQALVADHFAFQLFNVHIRLYDSFINELFTISVAPVQVNGPDKGFKYIPVDVLPKMGLWYPALHKAQKS